MNEKSLLQLLDEIREDQREMKSDQREMKDMLIRNTVSLEHHISRTDALEKRVEQVAADVKPLKEHVSLWAGAGKLLTWSIAIAGVVVGVLKLLLQ